MGQSNTFYFGEGGGVTIGACTVMKINCLLPNVIGTLVKSGV